MGNKSLGFKRKAKFGPGAVLKRRNSVGLDFFDVNMEEITLIVLDVEKPTGILYPTSGYSYKVFNKNNNSIQYLASYYVEGFKQVDLLNVGNLRILLDDASSDGTDEGTSPNTPKTRRFA